MFLPILIRISKKKYLEDLQAGKLFMRNVMYYQRLESTDTVRCDPFDGAIPAPGLVPRCLQNDSAVSDLNLQTTRFMSFKTYVACFFGIKSDQIDSTGHIVLSAAIVNELWKFCCEDALIIDLNRFAKRLSEITDSKQAELDFRHVKYLTDEEYIFELKCLLQQAHTTQPIEFMKRKIFSNQQEFRISCKNDLIFRKFQSSSSSVLAISPEMAEQMGNAFITIDIGSIQDFSCIISLKDLLEGKIQLPG